MMTAIREGLLNFFPAQPAGAKWREEIKRTKPPRENTLHVIKLEAEQGRGNRANYPPALPRGRVKLD